MMRARIKRQADPYAEESSDPDDDDDAPGESFYCLPCFKYQHYNFTGAAF